MACGTYYGYRLHLKLHEAPCAQCRYARSAYEAARTATQPCVDCGDPHSVRAARCDACARIARKQEFCKRGHRRTPDNVKPNGNCRECNRLQRAGAA